jgi:hypothetical protein
MITIGHEQGNRWFSGALMCQGPVIWAKREVTFMSLDPDGCLVRRI